MSAPQLPSAELGLHWRSITLDDIHAWFELEQAIEVADNAVERFDRVDLVEELTEGTYKTPHLDSIIGFDADGVPRAFGLMDLLPGASLRRAYLWGGVHPCWRGKGIGRALLTWQRDQARHVLAARESKVTSEQQPLPWRLMVNHPDRLQANNAIALAAGFTALRWSHDMVRDLRGFCAPPVPEISVPQPLRLVPTTPDLDEAVRLAHNESFAGHWGSQPRDWEAWHTWTVGHRTFRRNWSFAVVDTSRTDAGGFPVVVGYTTSHARPQEWAAQGYTNGWTALLGVRPGWRGRRLAAALLAAALRAFTEAGMDKAGLDVDTGNASGALGLYEAMGFTVRHTSITWGIDGDGSAAAP